MQFFAIVSLFALSALAAPTPMAAPGAQPSFLSSVEGDISSALSLLKGKQAGGCSVTCELQSRYNGY